MKLLSFVSGLILSSFLLAQKPIVGVNGVVNPFNYKIEKSKIYKNASVACAHPLAALCGAEIMKRGGNAFDAAITTQLVLAVVYPGAGNIGGGGFIVARTNKGKSMTLDYREIAPSKASTNMYLDKDGNAQTELSQFGHLAAGIPGTVAGLFETLPYCKLTFKQLIQPAIDIAENGFVITEREAVSLNNQQELFKKYNTKKSVFEKSIPWKVGDTLIQKDLAITLKLIREKGKAGFYEGKTAQLIVDEMQRGNGIISLNDLKNYKPIWRNPLTFNYKNYDIISMPPPSSGGVILCQLMKIIEQRNMTAKGFQTASSVQLMVEAERLAFADRAIHLGDPDFYKVPVETLTSNEYIKNRMKDYDSTKASKSKNIKAGDIKESEETTHISIADKYGNIVSITTTLNGSYGSKTVVSGAGFLLNNEMDDFSIKAGVANMYGAIGGKANAIEPNKRMLSSMTPTLVLKNRKPFLVVGTPGGTTIPTSVYQTLVNILEFGMNAKDAVNKPKFHHQWFPDEVFVEKEFDVNVRKELTRMGYKVTERGAIGRVELIKINGKRLETVADGRGDDCVAGW
jgi:gamma-glutamyltranspeptidase/glutathione hydrolase